MGLYTLGLSRIDVGVASPAGTMPGTMNKIGEIFKDTCKVSQDKADITEFFEEGAAAPAIRNMQKKTPTIVASLMNPDPQTLADYIGGTVTTTGTSPNAVTRWCFNGTETTPNKAVKLISTQGMDIEIPNASIEAVINAEFSTKGIFVVDIIITPLAVTAGGAIRSATKPA